MMNEEAQIESIDGRRKRSARSRAAIITATLTLLENGNLSPTAKQIAEEAGRLWRPTSCPVLRSSIHKTQAGGLKTRAGGPIEARESEHPHENT